MAETKAERWNRVYRETTAYPQPNPQLLRYRALLPAAGRALDLACGLGADGLYLAEQGFETEAWDASSVAIARLAAEASRRNTLITTRCVQVSPTAFTSETFDLIYVRRFLDRALFPTIITSLALGGVLFYETFADTHNKDVVASGPKNPDYRLSVNELLQLCEPLVVRLFIDGFQIGSDQDTQPAGQSLIIAQKPPA